MSRILIFTGPTLSRKQVLEVVPKSEVYPPVAAGDLLRHKLNPGDLVAIIDGFFYQSAAVRHKEILDLLYRGIHVWGASSMGALRAAELAPFGMRGFGRIFEAYVQGEIEGDDEVAVLHAPEDMDYAVLTEALVNVRHACEWAVTAGAIDPSVQQTIVATAAALPFYERTYATIFKYARENGLSQRDVAVLQDIVLNKQPNLKRNDALELLQVLQHPPLEALRHHFEWHETTYIHGWRIFEQRTYLNGEEWVADRDILTAYQLFCQDYPNIHLQLLKKILTAIATRSLTYKPFAGDICTPLIAQYLSSRWGFSVGELFPNCMERWLRPEEKMLSAQEQLVRTAIRLWNTYRGFDWRPTMLSYLKANGISDQLVRMVVEARAINEKVWRSETTLRTSSLSASLIHTWFARRWGVTKEDLELAVLDRGFRSLSDFTKKARFFYMLDNIVGVNLSNT